MEEVLFDEEEITPRTIVDNLQCFFIGALGIMISSIIMSWLMWGPQMREIYKNAVMSEYSLTLDGERIDSNSVDLDKYNVQVNTDTKEVLLEAK